MENLKKNKVPIQTTVLEINQLFNCGQFEDF